MINIVLTATIGSVLIAGVAFSPLLSGQFHSAYAQNNATTMSANMTGNATTTMSANMTGKATTTMSANMTGNTISAQGGNSVTISPGSCPKQWQVFCTPNPYCFKGDNSYLD